MNGHSGIPAAVAAARSAGLVGQGGAGFPTHVKLDAAVDTVIANGCECEPLLATDKYIMETRAASVLRGIAAAMEATGARRGILAVKAKHTGLAGRLREALSGSSIELLTLDNFYPAGDEQTLIYAATGKSVPPLSLPRSVGCLVSNVGTLASLAEALDHGLPVTERVVTVAGEISRPSVFTVPLGTSVASCIEHCGGATVKEYVVILGGPVMGTVVDDEKTLAAAVVTKTLGGIILLPKGHHLHLTARRSSDLMRKRAAAACIQCRYCTDMCPRYLIGQPFETHKVMRAFAAGRELEQEAAQNALLCCGCGVCEHVACPMGLSPCAINGLVKKSLAGAGITYRGSKDIVPEQLEWNAWRKVALPRLAARIGIGRYMDRHVEPAVGYTPDEVRLPLRQHIGAPGTPVVAAGDRVKKGDLVAEIPENALGARVHASIEGVVRGIGDSIIIGSA